MSNDDEIPQFSPKELEFIAELQEIIDRRGVTPMQKQIAQAKLHDLYKSKEPEPHNRSHRIRRSPEIPSRNDFNMFHNDEAFERYEMGGHQRPQPGGHNKAEEAAQNDYRSLKMNHKVRGTTKSAAKAELDHGH